MASLAAKAKIALWLQTRYGCKSPKTQSIVSVSPLPGRRSGALDDPEVKSAVAIFRDLPGMHTERIDMTRAVSNSTS
jgi:hypothetical protein